jgi:methylisocitrate lyase
MPLIAVHEAVAKIRAAVDARRDPDFIIVARTDAVDPNEALDRAAQYAEAGADLIQPISRSFKCFDDLVKLKQVTGRRLSLQLMQGLWMADLSREQIESVAAFATYPVVPLMSVVHAMQQNLATLAARRSGSVEGMPCGQVPMATFKHVIGWEAIEARQAHYELGSPAVTKPA